MLRQLVQRLALAAYLTGAISAYTWPNPYLDALEQMRWAQQGTGAGTLGLLVTAGPETGNRTSAADWLRTAYHDVATYDVKTGTGGLDCSIRFDGELQRSENVGDGFQNTLDVLSVGTNRFISLSDVLAVTAVFAVEAFGGPEIDYRGGRVDAQQAGPSGVPLPEGTLQSHTAAFARMGFTATEMIQLVACGHTIGGVQSKFFPTIVPSNIQNSNNLDGNVPFDSSFDVFDNRIATEYMSGHTNNPLVVGANVTTRSDARIFSSDGNATMKVFAQSPALFRSTCASLVARMIDTVPRGVKLTEVIKPLPVKPDSLQLMHLKNNSFAFTGNVRFWNLNPNSTVSVRLLWADQSNHTCESCSVLLSPLAGEGGFGNNIGTTFAGHISLWYQLPTQGVLISSSGISRFWFQVTQDGKTWIENQNGLYFPMQTSVVAADTSCLWEGDTSTTAQIDIAVRKGLHPSLVYLIGPSFDKDNTLIPAVSTAWPAAFNQTLSANNSAYDFYSMTMPNFQVENYNVGATIGGVNVTDWSSLLTWKLPDCA